MPLGLTAWRLLTGALSPVARLLLRRRAARGKEDWARLNERLGISGLPRPEGRLVWVHGEAPRPVFWIPPCRKQLERQGDYE